MSIAALAATLRPMALWAPIGLDAPQSLIDVTLDCGTMERDVTDNQVVLSLAPLVLAIGDPSAHAARRARLVFRDRAHRVELGALGLSAVGGIRAQDTSLACFLVDESRHGCLPAPLASWQRWLQARRRGDPRTNFSMSPDAVQHLLVFYICPRPVLLVSVADGVHENLFPMDLVGSLGSELFTLALRNTSPSVATLRAGGHAALADVPLADRALAYSLGAHHRQAQVDWAAVPCDTIRSSRNGLRVPAQAPRIRELAVLDAHERGSHTVFLCRVTSDERRASVPRLFHTSGMHRAWRRRHGTPPWREPQES